MREHAHSAGSSVMPASVSVSQSDAQLVEQAAAAHESIMIVVTAKTGRCMTCSFLVWEALVTGRLSGHAIGPRCRCRRGPRRA
jgi:hypothetical protein